MFLLANFREQLLPFLPKDANIAEIGVNLGEFSRLILDQCQPSALHLIDPWELSTADDDYAASVGENPSTEMAEDRYRQVCKVFKTEEASGQVTLHRAMSDKAVEDFDDHSLDWIYIDGNHSYESVKQDLELYLPKVRPDGLILGHDYANNSMSRHFGFGVVQAVNEVCREQKLHFLCLTFDPFPTYVLARDPEAIPVRTFLSNILYHLTPAVQINNFPALNYQQLELDFGEAGQRVIISLG